MKRGDMIEKTGLILDRMIMQSPELASPNATKSRNDTTSETMKIKTNDEFRTYLKHVNLLLYLKYPSVIELTHWDLLIGNKETLLNGIFQTKNCQLGSLYDIITDSKQVLSSTDKTMILYGIARAICYFQSKFVVHKQLNSKNIYIECKDNIKYPRIKNFQDSEIFYDPTSITLDMFSNDLESFCILLVEILEKSNIEEKVNLMNHLDKIEINESSKSALIEIIQHQKDPVTCIRKFVHDIEDQTFWLEHTDQEIFNSYKNDLDTFKEAQLNDDSTVLDIIEQYKNPNEDTNLKDMVKKLFDKSLNGNHTADFNLGICYLKGTGVPENFGIGFYYISKAAQKLPYAQALKIILQKNASVLESQENSKTLYQKAQIYECKNKYDDAFYWYTKSIEKAIEENKTYTPSIGRIGRLLTYQKDVSSNGFDDKFERLGIDYLKIGYDNDDPYAIFELFCYFKYKNIAINGNPTGAVYASPRIDNDPAFEEFRIKPGSNKAAQGNKIVYDKKLITGHLYDKAISLGLVVNEISYY